MCFTNTKIDRNEIQNKEKSLLLKTSKINSVSKVAYDSTVICNDSIENYNVNTEHLKDSSVKFSIKHYAKKNISTTRHY